MAAVTPDLFVFVALCSHSRATTWMRCISIQLDPFPADILINAGALSTEAGKTIRGILLSTPTSPGCCQHEKTCRTHSKKRNGSIIQPGTPEFSCSVVDPVLLPWKLVLGVEVMIAHGCIDFST